MSMHEERVEIPRQTSEIERRRRRILYLSLDGVLEPIGRSQILHYVYGLSERGFAYTLVSLERERDLSDFAAVADLEREMAEHDIRWIRLPYDASGGARAIIKNCYALFFAARRTIRQDYSVRLIHARSYLPAAVSWLLRKLGGRVSYLFDVRGYWVDELADDGRWFNDPYAYKVGKWMEKRLLKEASAIVTLTQLHADYLRASVLRSCPDKLIVAIPTCADYDEFAIELPPRGNVPQAVRAQLADKLTVGLVGSINASYCMAESLHLFRCLLEKRADAHLICLSRQREEMETLLRREGIPESAYTLTTVRHQDMAAWLGLMNWALLLLNTKRSKLGSMPTKLAEFFAAGVRPIQYGCNAEVSQKVRESGSGIVLGGLSETDLREAARVIASTPLRREEVIKARETTRDYFSVEAGVKRYEQILVKLLGEEKA